MASPLGTILNESTQLKRVTHIIKAGNTVVPGLCYIDGSNGVKNAPVDGSIDADELFWYPKAAVTVAVGAASKKITIWAIDGLEVIGQADGALVVNVECKPSTTAAHGGQFITHTLGTATVAAFKTDLKIFVGTYRGHEAELKEGVSPLTNAADVETDLVFELRVVA